MFQRNIELFDELRKLDLPMGEYLIIASGPLGVRQLREMKDVDIKVTDKLWDELSKKYEVFYDDCRVMKLRLSENVEAMCEKSFAARSSEIINMEDQLKDAEMFDDLPFENISRVLYFKKKSSREKDKNDVQLIEKWLEGNK